MNTSTALKMEVFAPMPIPRERTAMAMRPRLRFSERRPNFTSCQMMSMRSRRPGTGGEGSGSRGLGTRYTPPHALGTLRLIGEAVSRRAANLLPEDQDLGANNSSTVYNNSFSTLTSTSPTSSRFSLKAATLVFSSVRAATMAMRVPNRSL